MSSLWIVRATTFNQSLGAFANIATAFSTRRNSPVCAFLDAEHRPLQVAASVSRPPPIHDCELEAGAVIYKTIYFRPNS